MTVVLEAALVALWEAGAGAAFFNAAGWIGANAALVNTALLAGASYAHSADKQRQLRNQARDSFNSSLQDRQITVRSAVAPRGALYGRDKVGGQLADAFVTGSLGQYLHLVVAFYGHECDACETIYLNNIALPTPDASGFINSGVFAKTVAATAVESTSAGSLVLAHTPVGALYVTYHDGVTAVDYTATVLTLNVDYTVSGSTVTFTGGALTGTGAYTVNYSWETASPRVRVKVHRGEAGQVADADLVSESGGRWTSADVGAGIAYIYFRFEYDVDIFGQIGVPTPTALWRGKKVLDTRSSTTAWSDNWALCVRDWLRDSTHGLGCTAAEVPSSEISTAANICDEAVTLYNTGTVSVTGGSATVTGSGTAWLTKCYPGLTFRRGSLDFTVASVASNTSLTLTSVYTGSTASGQSYELRQKRYTVNGTLGTEDSPLANLKRLLAAGAGTATWVQGRWLVRAGAYLTPTTTISEDYLAAGAVEIIPRASRRDQCNRVSGTYLDSAEGYAEKQYPPQSNSTYRTADGGQELTREVNWWGVTDSYRAQRLAKIELERSRQAMQITLQCNHRAYDYAPSDTANLSLARYGWSPKVVELRSRKYTPGVGISYVCKETASTVFQWNLGDETLYNPSAATSLPNPFTAPAALAGLACDSGATVNALLANALAVRGLVTWTISSDIFVRAGGRIEVEWKLWTDDDWQKAQSVPGDSTSTYISPLAPRSVTLVRVRPVNAAGRAGPWSTIAHSVASGGEIGGGNLIRNSSFEVESTTSGVPAHWTATSFGAGITIVRTLQNDGVHGTKALRLQVTAISGAATNTHSVLPTADDSPLVVAGGKYRISMSGKSTVLTYELRFGVIWLDAADATIDTDSTVVDVAAVNTWARYTSAVLTAPAGAVKGRPFVGFRRPSVGSTGLGTVYFDAVQLEPGGTLTGYAPRADELLAGVVGTDNLAGDAATEVYTATRQATGSFSSSA